MGFGSRKCKRWSSDGKVSRKWGVKEYHKIIISIAAYSSAPTGEGFPKALPHCGEVLPFCSGLAKHCAAQQTAHKRFHGKKKSRRVAASRVGTAANWTEYRACIEFGGEEEYSRVVWD